jgi:hypothetical protein
MKEVVQRKSSKKPQVFIIGFIVLFAIGILLPWLPYLKNAKTLLIVVDSLYAWIILFTPILFVCLVYIQGQRNYYNARRYLVAYIILLIMLAIASSSITGITSRYCLGPRLFVEKMKVEIRQILSFGYVVEPPMSCIQTPTGYELQTGTVAVD